MNYYQFLERVINDGISAAKNDYCKENQKDKLEGSIAGFEVCRNKEPQELKEIYYTSIEYVETARKNKADNYWWFRCYQIEIEWVCNVISAILYKQGISILPHLPTANGMLKAADILNLNTEF